eukprot:m.100148 g.100148  ORF g.100148 m.100148 type:complete len:270 (+) comp27223_c0_seq5:592-1401(+)
MNAIDERDCIRYVAVMNRWRQPCTRDMFSAEVIKTLFARSQWLEKKNHNYRNDVWPMSESARAMLEKGGISDRFFIDFKGAHPSLTFGVATPMNPHRAQYSTESVRDLHSTQSNEFFREHGFLKADGNLDESMFDRIGNTDESPHQLSSGASAATRKYYMGEKGIATARSVPERSETITVTPVLTRCGIFLCYQIIFRTTAVDASTGRLKISIDTQFCKKLEHIQLLPSRGQTKLKISATAKCVSGQNGHCSDQNSDCSVHDATEQSLL